MQERAIISVIIPVYNRRHLVGATLESVQRQTFEKFECIVVDDCSSDGLEELIQDFNVKNKRIVYHRHAERKGAPAARNTGLSIARGEYIMFLDSDDLLLPSCLENRFEILSADPELDFVVSLQKLRRNGKDSFLVNVPNKENDLVRFFTLHPPQDIPWVNNMVMVKKSYLEKNNIRWNETLNKYQDIQFHLELLLHEPKYRWSDKPFDCYWTLSDLNDNIGSDRRLKEAGNISAIMKVYDQALRSFNGSQFIRGQMRAQFLSMMKYYLLLFAQSEKTFLQQVSTFLPFSSTERKILHTYYNSSSAQNDDLLKRGLRKIIRAYFNKKYRGVIRSGTFLNQGETRPLA